MTEPDGSPSHNASPSLDSATRAVRLQVSGVVQGVGFRAWARNMAITHRITGWVRNTSSGDVEIFAQADKKSLDDYVEAIKQGSTYSRVDRVTVEPARVQGITGFEIAY